MAVEVADAAVDDNRYLRNIVQYACPFALSLVFTALLWNITLLCKVQFFRNKLVTKLTYLPYILSFCFLMS